MRLPQPRGTRGSQKWIQHLVNDRPDMLNAALAAKTGPAPDAIRWRSPLASDDFAEYRDAAFLDRLGVELPIRPLKKFWPARGPQWDALGRTETGDAIYLVEAKAHIAELVSSCQAVDAKSLKMIAGAFREVQDALAIRPLIDWRHGLYQTANRLAHLYLLREINRLPAWFISIGFVGDTEMNGPGSPEEWRAAETLAATLLGARTHRLARFHVALQIDVRSLAERAPYAGSSSVSQ